ncbi:MAG: acyltransferase [Alphaproteobacteria bacterium]|nr:acyltransferase [Alphaproteobacteria bacterium]
MKILFLLIALLPSRLKIFVYNAFFGCEIDPTASIGFSYIQVKKIKMGPGSRIRHLNIVRNLELFELGEYSSIINRNSFSALPLPSTKHFTEEKDRFPAFIMGKHSSIGKRHFFDCNNTIKIGNYSAVTGFSSAFYTHGVNISKCKQETKPVNIGDYCRIYTRCIVVKGAKLPDGSFLGPGSTLHKSHEQTHGFYSGVPAKLVKTLDPSLEYFHREQEYIG